MREKRETAESLINGLLEGIAFCLPPRNKSAVITTIMKRLKLNDAAAAEEGYLDVLTALNVNRSRP